MNGNDLVKAWFAKAASDLRNAEIILASGVDDIPADTVCFHCQQAVEKYLKGFLAGWEKEFPLTHNLKALVEAAMTIDPAFKDVLETAETLTPYAVSIRYPDDLYMPSREEADEAFAIAQDIKNLVLLKSNQATIL